MFMQLSQAAAAVPGIRAADSMSVLLLLCTAHTATVSSGACQCQRRPKICACSLLYLQWQQLMQALYIPLYTVD